MEELRKQKIELRTTANWFANMRLHRHEVEQFIGSKNTQGIFKNQKVKIRCEGDKKNRFLCLGLDLLAGIPDHHIMLLRPKMQPWYDENEELDESLISTITADSTSRSHLISNFGWSSQLDDLLKCKYVIENLVTSEDQIDKKQVRTLRGISSDAMESTNFTINIEQEKFNEKGKIDGTEKFAKSSPIQEVTKSENNSLKFNFFHLAIISEKPKIIETLMNAILEQCLEELKIGRENEKYIMRNLKLALTEKVFGEHNNIFLNGMNAIHIATFMECAPIKEILNALEAWTDNLTELHLERKIKHSYNVLDSIRVICKLAMTDQTFKTKETPTNMAARYCGYF